MICREAKEYNRIGYVYEGALGMIDRSNEGKPTPFYVHLFTYDAPGNFLTPDDFEIAEKAIGTLEQVGKKNELEKLINSKLEKLTNYSDF